MRLNTVGNTNHLEGFISFTQQDCIKIFLVYSTEYTLDFARHIYIKTPLQIRIIQSNQQKMADANTSPQTSESGLALVQTLSVSLLSCTVFVSPLFLATASWEKEAFYLCCGGT